MWEVKLTDSKATVNLKLAFTRETVTTGALAELKGNRIYQYDDLDNRQKSEIVRHLFELMNHEVEKINQEGGELVIDLDE